MGILRSSLTKDPAGRNQHSTELFNTRHMQYSAPQSCSTSSFYRPFLQPIWSACVLDRKPRLCRTRKALPRYSRRHYRQESDCLAGKLPSVILMVFLIRTDHVKQGCWADKVANKRREATAMCGVGRNRGSYRQMRQHAPGTTTIQRGEGTNAERWVRGSDVLCVTPDNAPRGLLASLRACAGSVVFSSARHGAWSIR